MGRAGTQNLNVVLANFQVDQWFGTKDVTAFAHSGINKFYVYMSDAGGPAGLQFAATFDVTSAAVPLPPAAWMGLGMLGLVGLVRRRKQRLA